MRKPRILFGRLFLSLLLQSVLAAPLLAWGRQGHELAASAALEALPPGLAPWFQGREAVVVGHALDPDHWKSRDPQEGPRHFLDSEAYGGADRVPRLEAAPWAQLGAELFQKTGQVPWVILDEVQNLSDAFRGGDPHQVAVRSAILSHYVADLSVPLHTTTNHDGADTGQDGLHQRWETGLIQRVVSGEQWRPEVRPAVLGSDPWALPMAWLVDSFALVPRILADDLRAEQGNRPADALGAEPSNRPVVDPDLIPGYWEAFLELQGPVVKAQLRLAAQRTAEMILWAWTRAGQPACR